MHEILRKFALALRSTAETKATGEKVITAGEAFHRWYLAGVAQGPGRVNASGRFSYYFKRKEVCVISATCIAKRINKLSTSTCNTSAPRRAYGKAEVQSVITIYFVSAFYYAFHIQAFGDRGRTYGCPEAVRTSIYYQ